MEFGFVIVVAIAWMVLNAVREAMKQLPGGRPPGPPGARRTPLQLPESLADASPGLRDLLAALEQARGPVEAPKPAPRRLPPAEKPEFVEDTTSLESESRDSASIEAARRRREWAAQRARPRTAADHAAFDARIRQEAADATSVATPAVRPNLREALIWREILGPPVSLRDD